MSVLDLYALAEQAVAGQRLPMMLFPIGTWKSAKYPKLPLTRELADELIANFEAGVLGTEPVIDSSGRHDTSTEAAGWVKRLYVAQTKGGGEALYADWEPTDLGASLLNERRYQYNSVEIGDAIDNATGKRTANVLRSATLTNTPVLRMLPPVLEAGESIAREAVALSLSELEPVDPVAELLADIEALAAKLDDALRGKRGVPVARTFMRELRAKVGAHKLADDDDTEPTPLSEEPTDGATVETVDDSATHEAVGRASEPKEHKHMSELTELLKLAEDADDALVLAEVKKVYEERDTLLAEKATAAQAERERKLDEAISSGHIAPAEKDVLARLAESDPETFATMLEVRKGLPPVVDLTEHGSGDTAPEPKTYPNASVELAERARERAAKDGSTYAEAELKTLAEDAALAERYLAFRAGKEA